LRQDPGVNPYLSEDRKEGIAYDSKNVNPYGKIVKKGNTMSNHPKVLITDETLRDGLQIDATV
jgi:hypothetical protein